MKSIDAQLIIIISLFFMVYLVSETITGALQAAYAKFLGDDTAEREGFLTLDPFKFIDVLGTIALFTIGIGWGKAIPIDSRLIRRPFRSLKILSLYSSRIIAHICLGLLAALFLVKVKPLPLVDLKNLHIYGFQSNGRLIAKGYSGGSIIAGLFAMQVLSYNFAIAILRVFVRMVYASLESLFEQLDLDFEFSGEMIFLFVFALIYLFDRQLQFALYILDFFVLSFFFGY